MCVVCVCIGGRRVELEIFLTSANAHLFVDLFLLSGFHYISKGIDNLSIELDWFDVYKSTNIPLLFSVSLVNKDALGIS